MIENIRNHNYHFSIINYQLITVSTKLLIVAWDRQHVNALSGTYRSTLDLRGICSFVVEEQFSVLTDILLAILLVDLVLYLVSSQIFTQWEQPQITMIAHDMENLNRTLLVTVL